MAALAAEAAPMAAGMFSSEGVDKTAAMGVGGKLAEQVIGGAFNLGAHAINASASNYGADQNLASYKYQSDRNLQGIQYATDATYKMWDRDYKIANSMGLYHPSQLAQVSPDSTMLRLSHRGIARVQRTHGRSIFQ